MKILHKKLEGKLPTKEDIDILEEIIGVKLTLNLKDFLLKYSNCSIEENFYLFNNQLYIVNDFLPISNGDVTVLDLTEEFIKHYGRKYVPFAFDPGGWHFCLCLDEIDYNKVIINRWTDDFEDGQFLRIADSFELFVSGLLTVEEVIEKGYIV